MDPPPLQTPSDPPPPPPEPSDPPAPATNPNPNPNPNPAQSQEQMNHLQLPPQSQTLQQRMNPAMPRPRGGPPGSGTVGPIQSQSQRMAMGVPAPFSSFRPSHPFAGPPSSFPHHPPWTAPGGPEQAGSSSSSSQVRQPVPGVQPIGIMSSMNHAAAAAQMRASGVTGQNQQRPGQPQVRPTSQSANQTKLPAHGVKAHPMATTSSQSSGPALQSSQSLQQQWMLTHGRQSPSLPSSSPYRPPIKQPIMQQRPQHPQQQHMPMTSHHVQAASSQQQQQQVSLPNQSQEQHIRNQQPFLPPQQQAARPHAPTTSKSNLALVQPGMGNLTSTDIDESSNDIINRKRIRELVTQADPSEKLRPEIEDDLLEIADDFIESIVTAACQLAKHRKSTILEAKDMLLHVERHWNMALPGFTGDEIKCYKKQFTNDIHRERVAMIKKSMVGTNEGGSARNPSTGGQSSANPKAHASKTPAIGSP